MRVLMVGVDKQTKGGMWTVAENYLRTESFVKESGLEYVPTSITGSIPKKMLFTAKALVSIFAKLLTNQYDILHVHMAEHGSVYRKNLVITLAKLFGCKVIIHMHGAEFETWYQTLSEKKKRGVRRILCKADRVLILGEYWREFVCALVEDGSRVCVLHNAVSVPAKNPYNPNAQNLLFLGVVGKRKGIGDLLEAVKQIDNQLPKECKLMLYGPESDGPIAPVVGELGLSHRVKHSAWLSGEDKAKVFAETAVNILPSYNEGLPMSILETMASGIPNITTTVAAIPEVVNEQNGALICPSDVTQLAQEILNLMSDPVARVQKSGAAYEKVKAEFSISRHTGRLLDIYRELT